MDEDKKLGSRSQKKPSSEEVQRLRDDWELAIERRDKSQIIRSTLSYIRALRRKRDFGLALAVLRQIDKNYGFRTDDLLFERAICLRHTGRRQEAVELLDELLSKDNLNSTLKSYYLNQKASCLKELGKRDEALAITDEQLKRNPDDPYAQDLRRRLQEDLEKTRQQLQETKQQLRETEQFLEQSRRSSYLGLMATGIAHQINQPVGIIRAKVTAAQSDLQEGLFDPKRELPSLLEDIRQQTERLDRIIRLFRERARADRSKRQIVAVNDVMRQAIESIFSEQFRERGIGLEYQLTEPSPCVWANPYELEEVIVNLVSNARDALEGRRDGVITLTSSYNSRGEVVLAVIDNGPGLAESVHDHLYTPFFSTKTTEKGTGLGLYIARDIVHNHDGRLEHESVTPGGACFKIILPALDEKQMN
ncbi:MAG: tetratricopeptide repeat protein [Anaerolineae bacterium]|nr:tetratricopeptide repeat protein [Anaerolineae bacterium]MDW8172787.1 tetratricopeptide repeat protein [Anaerolineae bacterium]